MSWSSCCLPRRSELGLIRTGLRSAKGESPSHTALFSVEGDSFDLGDADELVVPLRWEDGSGLFRRETPDLPARAVMRLK